MGLPLPQSAHCQLGHMAALFVLVNAGGGPKTPQPPRGQGSAPKKAVAPADGANHDTDSHLCRHEWLELLVRAAVARYVRCGQEADVSGAVRRLLSELVAPRLAPVAGGARDDFRGACCYREDVDRVLRRHEVGLRVMFERYSEGTPPDDCMCFDEWKDFCVDLGFVDAAFTLREAMACFVRSRMQAVDECSERGWSRTTNLGLEDFLEAVVRVSTMKALPTDAEVDRAGCSDAGQFLLQLRGERPADFQRFLAERAVDPLRPGATQPVARCVEHLCMLMVRAVERATQAPNDAKTARQEAGVFAPQRHSKSDDSSASEPVQAAAPPRPRPRPHLYLSPR